MNRLCIAALLAALSSMPVTALAPPALAEAPGLVPALREAGARLLPLGRAGGLVGYLVHPRHGAPYPLYVTRSGHGVVGLLYGPDGRALTPDRLRAALDTAPGPSDPGQTARKRPPGAMAEAPAAPADARIAAMTGAVPPAPPGTAARRIVPPSGSVVADSGRFATTLDAAFRLGEAGPDVAILADPICPHSRAAVAEFAARAIAGDLRLHVVPVGALGADAAQQAARIAAAEDPALAWFTGEADAAGERSSGPVPPGPTPPGRVPGRIPGAVAASEALLDAWHVRAVPLVLRRIGPDRIARHEGRIADPEAWLATPGGEAR